MRKSLFWSGVIALMAASGPAGTQTRGVALPADDVIAARQAGFEVLHGALAGVKAAIDAGREVQPLVESAAALATWGRVIPLLFPDGTEAGHNTRARPEIWSDRAGFAAASANFVAAAEALARLAEANDKPSLRRNIAW